MPSTTSPAGGAAVCTAAPALGARYDRPISSAARPANEIPDRIVLLMTVTSSFANHLPQLALRWTRQPRASSTSPLRSPARPGGFDHGDRGHIDDAPHRGRRGQNVRRRGAAEQDGTHGDVLPCRRLQQVISNVGAVQIGADQEVGAALQGAARQYRTAGALLERTVAVHFG